MSLKASIGSNMFSQEYSAGKKQNNPKDFQNS